MSVPCKDSELINFMKSHQTKDVSTEIGMYDLGSLKIALGLLGRVLVLCYFQKCVKVSVSSPRGVKLPLGVLHTALRAWWK